MARPPCPGDILLTKLEQDLFYPGGRTSRKSSAASAGSSASAAAGGGDPVAVWHSFEAAQGKAATRLVFGQELLGAVYGSLQLFLMVASLVYSVALAGARPERVFAVR